MTDSGRLDRRSHCPGTMPIFAFAEHVSYEHSIGSSRHVFTSRREGNINKQTKISSHSIVDRVGGCVGVCVGVCGEGYGSHAGGWVGGLCVCGCGWARVGVCGEGYGSHTPEVLQFGRSGVARNHFWVNTVSQRRLTYKLCSLPFDWQRLPVDIQL